MKTTNLSAITQQLSLLALQSAHQNQHPTTQTLRAELALLLQTLQLLYPKISAPEAQPSELAEEAFVSKLSLALQRFLFAGALRAKEFQQLQQALSLQREPTPEALSLHAREARELLQSFVPK